jgi:hypothetical protein
MNKLQYLKFMAKHKLYAKKKILINCFAIVVPDDIGLAESYVGQICTLDDKVHVVNEELTPEILEGWVDGQPFFKIDEVIELDVGDIANIKSKVKTTYGIALVNMLMLTHSFEDKIDYINGTVEYAPLEASVLEALHAKSITVAQLRVFLKTVSWATGIMPLFIAPTSIKSIQGAPEAKTLRNKLVKEREGRLDDPTALAEIDTELAALDKEYIKGDITETFYKSGKAHAVTRKRMYSIFGGEADFEDPAKMNLVTNSLEEEWDVKQMPAMINSLRMGSYKRGAETALGGADFKDLSRMFQNIKIAEDDCKSKVGKPILFTNESYKRLAGRVDMKGKELTETDAKALVGKRVILRSPQACQTKGSNYCKVCVGKAVSINPNSVGMLAANLGASFLSIMMAAMHGRALKLVEIDLDEVLS